MSSSLTQLKNEVEELILATKPFFEGRLGMKSANDTSKVCPIVVKHVFVMSLPRLSQLSNRQPQRLKLNSTSFVSRGIIWDLHNASCPTNMNV